MFQTRTERVDYNFVDLDEQNTDYCRFLDLCRLLDVVFQSGNCSSGILNSILAESLFFCN